MLIRRQVFFSEFGDDRLYSITERCFGKLDALEAERKGITVAELRKRRAGYTGTGTVHDSINLKQTGTDPNAAAKRDLGAKKKGYTTANARDVQQESLEAFKEAKITKQGKPRSAKGVNSVYRDHMEDLVDNYKAGAENWKADRQGLRQMQKKVFDARNTPSTVNTNIPKPEVPKPSAARLPKPVKPNTSLVTSKVGLAGKALKSPGGLSRNSKIGLGIAGGTALLGAGGLAYRHYKNKNNNQ